MSIIVTGKQGPLILVDFWSCAEAHTTARAYNTQSWRTGLGPVVGTNPISWSFTQTIFLQVDSNYPLRYLPAQKFRPCISIVVLTSPVAVFAVLAAPRPPH